VQRKFLFTAQTDYVAIAREVRQRGKKTLMAPNYILYHTTRDLDNYYSFILWH